MSQTVVFFDFDHTLIEGDSLWPFLTAVRGKPALYLDLLSAAAKVFFSRKKGEDRKTAVKAELLRRIFKGRQPEAFRPAALLVRRWMRSTPVLDRLHEHAAKGHHIVIATGSLDLYMPALLEDWPHHALLCTEMQVEDRLLTGEMAKGNCVRQTKADRVAAYIQEQGPFEDSWAYGNFPDDIPMLLQVRGRVIV